MSQYVTLIRTCDTPNTVIDPYRLPITLYALTTTNHPPTGLALLQHYCPVKLETIHSIRAGNASDNLLLTLKIKFQNRHLHSFWYALSLEDVNFIKLLTETNFNSMIGFI